MASDFWPTRLQPKPKEKIFLSAVVLSRFLKRSRKFGVSDQLSANLRHYSLIMAEINGYEMLSITLVSFAPAVA